MNFKNTPLWEYLFLLVILCFSAFCYFNVEMVVPVNIDPSATSYDVVMGLFYSIPLKEHFNFLLLVFVYAVNFVAFYIVAFLAYLAAWLVNCIGIHIQYRKPQRVYTPKT